MLVRWKLVFGLALLCGTSLPAYGQVVYTVADLGFPTNGPFPFSNAGATGISNSGQVTGDVATTFPGAPPVRAFRYTPGLGMIELGSFVSAGTSNGTAINDLGQVVGVATGTGGGNRAFRYTDGVGLTDLGVLSGQASSVAFAINGLGHVVGGSGSPFRYTDATGMVNLGLPTGAVSGRGVAINNAGSIAVLIEMPGEVRRAFGYTDAGGYVDLGTLGGAEAIPRGMNAAGYIVGSSTNRAFLYTESGGMTSLGLLPGGTNSGAFAINALDVIVGVGDSPAGAQRAFVLRPGFGMADLNALIEPGTGWTLRIATGVNDAGQIVGIGDRGGIQRAFLLTPVPEPNSLILIAATLAGASIFGRRRKNI